MDINNFNFENITWLWGLLLIPIFWLFFQKQGAFRKKFSYLKKFIDSHLLPELLQNTKNKKNNIKKFLIIFSLLWVFLIIGLANPRWKFSEQKTYVANKNLVILLSLSTHMNSNDIAPSRINRAKQIITDLIRIKHSTNLGFVTFAKTPHIITPLTTDKSTIANILPYIDTDLIAMQGSSINKAILRTSALFQGNKNNDILLISDGNFEDSQLNTKTKNLLQQKSININVVAIGTQTGAPMLDINGKFIKNKNDKIIISRLRQENLLNISKNHNGFYLDGNYDLNIAQKIIDKIEYIDLVKQKKAISNSKIWQNEFYIFIILAMIAMVFIRKDFLLAIAMVAIFHENVSANPFLNQDQKAQKYFQDFDFENAAENFTDSYNVGVAKYHSNDFAGAQKEFQKTSDFDISARYNLANSFFRQRNFQEAVKNYQEVLNENPEHKKAQHNLKVAKKILKEKPKQKSKENDPNGDKKEQKSQDQSSRQQRSNKNQKESEKQNPKEKN
ncbi:VWA domain-containing protein, partial [Flavobacteriaceae bacterium]|nr:VWA domain-containing protein [Flavobacteriaceae bacterium]